ncbi:hypothetical protein C8J57DRAFT_1556735 [Mycena rebaudengoi]|nr:hypothetical protein C8J57DRAFT_1556735 [Mycena rebaudengoi]
MAPRPEGKKAKAVNQPVCMELVDPPGQVITRIDPATKIHWVNCDLCGTEIKMTVSANRYNLIRHRDACKVKAKQKQGNQFQPNIRTSALNTLDFLVSASGSTTPMGAATPRPYYRTHVRQESIGNITTALSLLGTEPNIPRMEAIIAEPQAPFADHLTPTAILKDCPGVSIPWTPGSHWMTYPYLQHGVHSVGWEPISFGEGNTIQFHAGDCGGHIPTGPCISCCLLPSSSKFRKFMARAAEALPHTPWEYLSAEQQLKLMKSMAQSTKDLRTQASNVSQRKISEHRRIMMLLATNDIPGLQHMLTILVKRGASPQAICFTLIRGIAGTFKARGGFTPRDMDIAFLAKAIGGPRLLYALQKSLGLASLSTVKRHKKIPKLVASIGIPTHVDIYANISSFLDPEIKPPPTALGGGTLQKDKKDPGKVCFGSDGTVVAIAPYAELEHYTPVPLVLSPSCKTEKGVELAKWIQTVLDTWDSHPLGRALHGRIESLASDGDSSYRLAKHILCMVMEIDPQSPLGKITHSLLGLNCFTSKDGDATLLRNSGGIMIGPTNIQPDDIVTHLAALPDVTIKQAKQLLDRSDKQNVPKAVALVQQLYKLQNLPPPINPTDVQTRKAIVFFSKVLSFFVFPFIKMEMSLSEQVESLLTYAFLAAALEIKHDSQATIKNIIFMIAKMQILNPNLKFYIILEGTDRLEVLGVAALINAAFQRNPDLDRGHRRLSLSGALGIDHVNPASWKGDACVGYVELRKRWDAGEVTANNLLEEYFGPSGRVDFTKRFADRKCDLLRPLGHYVGLDAKHEDKRSEEENELPLFPGDKETEEGVEKEDDSNRQTVLSPEDIQSVQTNFLDDDFQHMPLGMDLDQFFPDEPLKDHDDGTNQDDDEPVAFSKVLEVEGKQYLKSSLVATLSSNRSKKATMRTLKCEDFDPTDLDDNDLLKSGDLVATLIHVAEIICLGIFLVKGIRVGADKFIQTAVSLLDLENPESKATVLGQLMEMQNPLIEGPDSAPATFWEWSGQYLSLDVNTREDHETQRMFVAEIPGILIHPVGPSVSKASGSNAQATWSIPTQQLTEIMEDAWQSLDPDGNEISTNVEQLVKVVNPSIPYCDALGTPCLIIQNVPEHLTRQKLHASDKIPCLICGVVKKLNEMRHHVAKHILMALRGVHEEGLPNPVGSQPCGFCGLDGCSTQLTNLKHPKNQFQSNQAVATITRD